jgi:hypothetical protein
MNHSGQQQQKKERKNQIIGTTNRTHSNSDRHHHATASVYDDTGQRAEHVCVCVFSFFNDEEGRDE